MNKKLVAKAQKLSAKSEDVASSFSNAFVMEPENAGELERYGTLYVVYEVSGSVEVDTLVMTKLVHDILYDTYFHSDNSAPVQVMEKAVLSLRERILGVYGSQPDVNSSVSIIVSVLWGNVLYLVQYGNCKSYLMREGELKSINAASEGNFSVASGVVKDDDVVIFATQTFLSKHSVEDLMSSNGAVSVHDLPQGASALILKFVVDTTFSKDELLDIQSEISPSLPQKPSVTNLAPKSTAFEQMRSRVNNALKIVPALLPRLKTVSPKKMVFIAVILVLLAFGIFLTHLANTASQANKNLPKPPVVDSNQVRGTSTVAVEEEALVDTSKDAEYKISREQPELFYELKLVDADVFGSSILVVDDNVVVADYKKGKLYSSQVSTPKFQELNGTFSDLRSVFVYPGYVGFVDSKGLNLISPVDEEDTDVFSGDYNLVASYFDFFYSLSPNDGSITKYTQSSNSLEASDWGTFSELIGAKSLGINVDIYVLDKQNKIQRFSQGEKVDFDLSAINPPLNTVAAIYTQDGFDYIYLLDSANGRVIVLDDEGEVFDQIWPLDPNIIKNANGIAVSPDESWLFILSGTQIHKIIL